MTYIDVTGHILKDAQRKQRGSEEKLAKLEVESLLAKRDAIIAQGVMYKLIEFDCQASIKDNQNEVERGISHLNLVILSACSLRSLKRRRKKLLVKVQGKG